MQSRGMCEGASPDCVSRAMTMTHCYNICPVSHPVDASIWLIAAAAAGTDQLSSMIVAGNDSISVHTAAISRIPESSLSMHVCM